MIRRRARDRLRKSCSGFFPIGFNGDVSAWDSSSVTNMAATFVHTNAFNSELAWDTSKVTKMRETLRRAVAFNAPLDWDTSKVTDIGTRSKTP